MNKKLRAVFLAVGLLLFIFLVQEFGINNILSNIKRTGWWIIPIISTWFFVYLLNAYAWSIVLKPHRHKISFGEILSITISGFAINYITPVVNLGGEPYKILALKKKLGTQNAVSSVILYSMLHFFSSFIFWIAAIILILLSLNLNSKMQIIFISAFIVALLGVWFFYTRHKKGIFRSLLKLLVRLPFTDKLTEKLKVKENSLQLIDEQIIDFYVNSKSGFYTSLFLEVASRFVASVEFIFIMRAIGLELSFQEAVYINAFSSLAMNIFFFVPLTLGVREGSLYFLMNILKFSSGIGIYIGLVSRLRELFWIFVGLILIQFSQKSPNKSSSDIIWMENEKQNQNNSI
jgi:uncharacterized protein (TIRG00374 family)